MREVCRDGRRLGEVHLQLARGARQLFADATVCEPRSARPKQPGEQTSACAGGEWDVKVLGL
jgi:hypothetical protein